MQLLKKWTNPVQHGLVGLDIGSGAVKLVALRSAPSGWMASCAAWVRVEPSEDESTRFSNTLEAVRACFSQIPRQAARYAVCGLSGPDAAVRSFKFPTLPPGAVEQAVRFEAQQVCPNDMRHSILDYQMLNPVETDADAPKTQCGVLVAGAEKAVSDRCRLVTQAGANAAIIDADGLAALNCLSELEDIDRFQTVALIDAGWNYTNIILLGPSGLPFVRDINSGARDILAQVAEITSRDVDTLSRIMWTAEREPMPEDVLVAFHQAARKLVVNINETLKFCASQEKCPFAEKIYLCGAGAMIHPLVDLITDALPTEVTVFDPFAAIRVDSAVTGADLLKTRGPAFVVAAGLAMRTI